MTALIGPDAIADVVSLICLLGGILLHGRRCVACRGAMTVKSDDGALWDWMCSSDPFASYSFLPLHGLALLAACTWPLLAVRRVHSSARLLEIYLAAWCMCWFSPSHPFAATADCVDDESSCITWARSGECDKNKDFMLKTCRRACGACVSDGTDGSLRDRLHALGPRAMATGLGSVLLVTAGIRLCLLGLSDASQQRVSAAARLAMRPLAMCFAILMRTPLAPILRVVVHILRGGCAAALSTSCQVARALTRCANLLRRRLIVLLGGQLEDGLFDGGYGSKGR